MSLRIASSRIPCGRNIATPALVRRDSPRSYSTAQYGASGQYGTRPLLGRHPRAIPIELFRINSSKGVSLRDYAVQMQLGRRSFDLKLGPDGLVHPQPGPIFTGPNGASMRPMGTMLQEIVRGFSGQKSAVWRIPEGVELPKELVVLHEHSDHYSMQTTEPVELSVLNERISQFLEAHGEKMSVDEFCERYPF
ncbi:hypothetical protein DFH27DRAFT_556976 [Peziza echinospora]|nr:hypothetical protein DFH27DRAFT_556976 [Peziza echinospora]